MKTASRILILALGIPVALWTSVGRAGAHEHSGDMTGHSNAQHTGDAQMGEQAGHSHERCELHSGRVTMTQAHHFETLFAPDGVRLYMYSAEQNPIPMDKVTGSVTIKDASGNSREVKLVPNVPKKGEPTVYFCTMHDSPPQFTPGKCPNCGMTLVPQGGLFGAVDLSKAQPGSVKAVVHLTGLEGQEKEVTFTETNVPEEDDARTPGSPSGGKTSGHQHEGAGSH